jgi:hypothetical protein
MSFSNPYIQKFKQARNKLLWTYNYYQTFVGKFFKEKKGGSLVDC